MSTAADQIPPGTRVRARDDEWTVLSATPHDGCESVRLEGTGIANRGLARTLLRPFDLIESRREDARVRAVSRRRWSRHVAGAVLSAHPFGGLHSAASGAFHLLPYQLEPALAMLRHARLRLLIADDVGLGKTVQAGIILNELAARSEEFRALVVSPAGLREQWREELRAKFGLESTFADTAWLLDSGRALPRDVNPWSLPGIYATSLDLLKRTEVLSALACLTWDLVVIDEAHGATPGTDRLAAVRAVASRARRVVLLTASPPDSEPDHLAALCDAGRAPGEVAITIFRRTRSDTGVTRPRKSILLPIRLSACERGMHRALDRYTSLLWREAWRRSDARASLAAVILRKRALSSAGSLAHTLRRRLELLGREGLFREEQPGLPFRDEDPLDDALPDAALGAGGLADVAFERECLEEICDVAERAAARESKLRALHRLLRRVREPAIVFTEYRDTLRQIAASLPATGPPLLLHGGLTPRERTLVQRDFTARGGLLLATDAASEGLNLHHRCRLVVHFELPWTLTRLEQRTGRVDRMGQARRVHEIVLLASDTAERLVLAPLVRRMRIAGSQTRRAWSAPGESAVASAVLDGIALDEGTAPPRVEAAELNLSAEAGLECRRLALQRTLTPRASPTPPAKAGSSGTLVHVRCPRGAVTVVVALSLLDATGCAVHQEVLPLRVPVSAGAGSLRRTGPVEWAARFLRGKSASILAAALWRREAVPADVEARHARQVSALLERERQVGRMARPPQLALQAGLFDRRAVRDFEARQEAAKRLADDAADRVRSLEQDGRLRCDARILAIRS